MSSALSHRGPDAVGYHVDGPIALGHRRLSIIDLSEAAREPLTNEDGTLWLVFNGEVYNFRELRTDLEERHRFRSQGDCETILHLYEERGDEAVRALDGMFAFALWDGRKRRLLLARDRTGKKPLFYHDGSNLFAFASEVKALLAHPEVPHERDESAHSAYF
jgi:asparagine synthase (glutamine-hydrolysing)